MTVSNLRSLRNGVWESYSENWQGPNRGPNGGTYWTLRSNSDVVKYQQDDPGGTGQSQPKPNQAAQKQSSFPNAETEKGHEQLKVHGQKYAKIAREKWGDQAHAKINEMANRLVKENTPEARRKAIAAEYTLSALEGKFADNSPPKSSKGADAVATIKPDAKPKSGEPIPAKPEPAKAKPMSWLDDYNKQRDTPITESKDSKTVASLLDQWVSPEGDSKEYDKLQAEANDWANGKPSKRFDELYASTQERLKASGRTAGFHVYRGLTIPVDHPLNKAIEAGHLKEGDEFKMDGLGANSWSEELKVAARFANSKNAPHPVRLVLERVLDHEDVIACWRTHESIENAGESEHIARNRSPRVRLKKVFTDSAEGTKGAETFAENEVLTIDLKDTDSQRGIKALPKEDAEDFGEGFLWDEDKHPRDNIGQFAAKFSKAHVAQAKRDLAAGKIAPKTTAEPITSDISGKPIRRHVELPSGAKVHPDELHRIKHAADGEHFLSTDEMLTVQAGGKTEKAKSFATAIAGILPGQKAPVTISGPHGYSATMTPEEWKKLGSNPGGFAEWQDGRPDESVKTSPRLDILKTSLAKKQAELDRRFDEHFADTKAANGQPLNDKRNGAATVARWEEQSAAIRTLKDSIEATKKAIEIERGKITNVEAALLPASIGEMLTGGELTQWRKHPHTFFVPGVDKGRIVFDPVAGTVGIRYLSEIPKDQYPRFRDAFNKLRHSLAAEADSRKQTGAAPSLTTIATPKETDDFFQGRPAGQARLFAEGKGHWITIGGKSGEDGKRHGGTPVYIENGRITKGAPSLTGKRIDALDKPAEGTTVRTANKMEAEHTRDKWGKTARKEGIDPKHLHALAADVMAHDKESNASLNKMLAEVHRDYPHLKAAILHHNRGGDSAGLKELDKISQSFAHRAEYNHLFGGVASWEGVEEDHSERLHDYLVHGKAAAMSQDEAYEQAMEHLRKHHTGVRAVKHEDDFNDRFSEEGN